MHKYVMPQRKFITLCSDFSLYICHVIEFHVDLKEGFWLESCISIISHAKEDACVWYVIEKGPFMELKVHLRACCSQWKLSRSTVDLLCSSSDYYASMILPYCPVSGYSIVNGILAN